MGGNLHRSIIPFPFGCLSLSKCFVYMHKCRDTVEDYCQKLHTVISSYSSSQSYSSEILIIRPKTNHNASVEGALGLINTKFVNSV